jgi:putative alpha-1,2-mannosidase
VWQGGLQKCHFKMASKWPMMRAGPAGSGRAHGLAALLLLTATILSVVFVHVSAIDHPEEFVNLLAGSFTDGNRFSTGNTLPLIGMPWGFNHWSPQTKEDGRNAGSWWFNGNDHTFTWLRCTHQPSPWIGDWGHFLISPQLGGIHLYSPLLQGNPTSQTICR